MISVLRPYWKSLQSLNDSDQSIDLKSYLENWEKTHREGVEFYSYKNPPKPFQLTGFYPLYTDEENVRLEKEIDELIATTDLSVPSGRICASLSQEQAASLDQNLLSKLTLLDNSSESAPQSSSMVASNIAYRKFTSGVALTDSSQILEQLAEHVKTVNGNIKK